MNKNDNRSVSKLLPVLFGFFVMGFCDVVGISTSYVQKDFALNETLAGFIPSMVFIWFLLLSIPAALVMNRIGRKKMVQASNLVTVAGMLIPFIDYNLVTCMAAFALLGIGNTLLQVSLNPLLTNVVRPETLTSSLTAGQVVKAVSSFCGPFIAAFAAGELGDWQYLFPIYAAITLLSASGFSAPDPRVARNAACFVGRSGLLAAEGPHGADPFPRHRLRRGRRCGHEYGRTQAAHRAQRIRRRAGRNRIERLLCLPYGRRTARVRSCSCA